MSRAADLVKEWNSKLEFKIREHDLNKPTEAFVVKALLVLLEGLNIKDTFSTLVRPGGEN